MLLPIFGSCGLVGSLALQIVSALAETCRRPHVVIHVGTGAEFSPVWQQRQSDDVILFSDSPDAALTARVLETGLPLVVFLETPASIVRSVWQVTKTDAGPMRVRALSLAALHDLALSSSALVVRSDEQSDLRDVIATIATHYGIAATDDQIGQVIARIAPEFAPDNRISLATALDVLPLPIAEDAVDQTPEPLWRDDLAPVFESFAPLLEGRRVDHFVWPREVFLTLQNDAPVPLRKPIDLTGPARTLIWGPYLNLPLGNWQADVIFSCSENLAGCRMEIDVFSQEVLVNLNFDLPREGTYQLKLPIEIADPQKSLEVRFIQKDGTIEGRLDLQRVEFTRRVVETQNSHSRSAFIVSEQQTNSQNLF
jgi:hypothetical protein